MLDNKLKGNVAVNKLIWFLPGNTSKIMLPLNSLLSSLKLISIKIVKNFYDFKPHHFHCRITHWLVGVFFPYFCINTCIYMIYMNTTFSILPCITSLVYNPSIAYSHSLCRLSQISFLTPVQASQTIDEQSNWQGGRANAQ